MFRRAKSKMAKNPKILLVGSLPGSSKLGIFLNHEKCVNREDHHRLGQQPAIGIQLNTLSFLHRDRLIHLDIWNVTIPHGRYERLAPIYCDNVQAVIGVCSLDNESSFYRMQYWLNKFRQQNQTLSTSFYILAFGSVVSDQQWWSTTTNKSTTKVLPRNILEFGRQLGAVKTLLIRQRCTGRDLNEFFDDLLDRFYWSHGKKQSRIKLMFRTFLQRFQITFF